jgi:drug/metabolite transporter (DMT)-like permease
MTRLRVVALTTVAMFAFAGNSLLCRLALKDTSIDAGSFTSIRLIAGALALWLILRMRQKKNPAAPSGQGNWLSALALFVYAIAFSFAYVRLSAATGALLLFGAVQATMIGRGVWAGERLRASQWAGFMLALGGLVGLLLPGLAAPPLGSAAWMLSAGVAWGIYSLRGQGAGDPTQVTAGNFLRSVPLAVGLNLLTLVSTVLNPRHGEMLGGVTVDAAGLVYALASGALTSGIGYAVWYTVLPALKATHAATVQLSVPVIAAFGAIVFLGEALNWRLVAASVAILGGIALVILEGRRRIA